MKSFDLKYGNGKVKISIPDEDLLGVIDNKPSTEKKSEEEIILNALENPIYSARLKELVHEGEKVCIIISDITRAWQRMKVYIPYIVKEIVDGGVKEEDILFISATGSHRRQTPEEHKELLGELYGKVKIIDHVSTDKDSLVYLGTTSFGTPVIVNKEVLKYDHVVLTGSIIYHFLAGWAGGRKSILPGITAYETIMKNHALSLIGELGDGSNPNVKSGNIVNNPIHEDMMEAASFIRPTFMFNVIMGADGKISAAVSGNYVKAHEVGCKIVDDQDGVLIDEKADLVIATAGGFPKDIDFYQTIKTLINCREAVKQGGTIIILSECSQGLGGTDEVKQMLIDYDTVLDRERALREDYSISKYMSYYAAETADICDVILVSKLNKDEMAKANVKVVSTIEEALDITYNKHGKNLKTYVMPHGSTTLPKLK